MHQSVLDDSILQRGMCSLMQTGTLWYLFVCHLNARDCCNSDYMIVGFTPSGSIGSDSNVQSIALIAKSLCSTMSDGVIDII